MNTTWIPDRLLPSNTALLSMLVLMSALGSACQMSAEPEPTPGSDLAAWSESALALAPGGRPDAILVIDRTAHDFGQVPVAQTGAATVFTVHNTGPKLISGLATHLDQGTGFTTVELQFFEPGLLWHESVEPTMALATDAGRNIIAAGGDFPGLTKYSPDGQILWQTMSFGGVRRISVDASDNIGIIESYTGTLHKLDGAGNVQWTVEPASAEHLRYEAAFDPSGNLYGVGGLVSWDEMTSALRIEKYDPSGVLSWTRDFARGTFAWVDDMAVDPNGNVLLLVSEMLYDDTGWYDTVMSLRKYDGDGNLLWTIQQPLSTSSLDVDPAGNTFLIHYDDHRIEKRAPDGTYLWSVWLADLDIGGTLAVTPAGDVIVRGSREFGDGVHDSEVWAAKIDGATGERRSGIQIRSEVATPGGTALAVDRQGDVVLSGASVAYDVEWWLRKYDAAIFD